MKEYDSPLNQLDRASVLYKNAVNVLYNKTSTKEERNSALLAALFYADKVWELQPQVEAFAEETGVGDDLQKKYITMIKPRISGTHSVFDWCYRHDRINRKAFDYAYKEKKGQSTVIEKSRFWWYFFDKVDPELESFDPFWRAFSALVLTGNTGLILANRTKIIAILNSFVGLQPVGIFLLAITSSPVFASFFKEGRRALHLFLLRIKIPRRYHELAVALLTLGVSVGLYFFMVLSSYLADHLYQLGAKKENEGELTGAQVLYQNAIEIYPSHTLANERLCDLNFRQSNAEQALFFCTISMNQGSIDSYILKSWILIRTEDFNRAKFIAQRGLIEGQKMGNDFTLRQITLLWKNLSLASLKNREYIQAEIYIDRAISASKLDEHAKQYKWTLLAWKAYICEESTNSSEAKCNILWQKASQELESIPSELSYRSNEFYFLNEESIVLTNKISARTRRQD